MSKFNNLFNQLINENTNSLVQEIKENPIKYEGWISSIDYGDIVFFEHPHSELEVYATPNWERDDMDPEHFISFQYMERGEEVLNPHKVEFDGTYEDYKNKIIAVLSKIKF